MKIGRNRVVSIDYTIRLADGRMVENSTSDGDAPLTYLHGRSQIVPGVERAIEGAEAGSVVEVVVPPRDAFGDRDTEGIFAVPRGAFPPGQDVDIGTVYSATLPSGTKVVFRVIEVNSDAVVIDTNHPLAGETLHVWIAVRGVREATTEERHLGRVVHEDLPSTTTWS